MTGRGHTLFVCVCLYTTKQQRQGAAGGAALKKTICAMSLSLVVFFSRIGRFIWTLDKHTEK